MPGISVPGLFEYNSNMQLQPAIAAATANNDYSIQPHHPITCAYKIYYEEDGTFSCEHATAPPGDFRTRQCITHSLALLIVELGAQL